MHPQDYLDMKQALGLFDISKSAMNAMAEEITKLESESSKFSFMNESADPSDDH